MPPALTYPGVYIQELSDGIPAIEGVPTSITAFIGRAERGPSDKPVLIHDFADYHERFGGIWAESTMIGADHLTSEWKYIPVRRLALYIEESLYRGTQWAVFEPNVEPLWVQVRFNVGAFMHKLFRKGALQGSNPGDAYFVKCGRDTMTQNDIDVGIISIEVGFAAVRPAEFVVIRIQQIARLPES